jgi:hypothetical protein
MKYAPFLLALAASCSAATDASVTVLTGAYRGISINGNALPARVATSGGDVKQEIIADRLWIGGTAGPNGVLWRTVTRTTTGSDVKIDSTTMAGSFEATLASAQTTFGPISASGPTLTFHAIDGTVRLYERGK